MVPIVYLKLAIIYKKFGNNHKAITFFKACSCCKNLEPDHLNELLIHLASCFENIKNFKEASELYMEALKLQNNSKNIVCLA